MKKVFIIAAILEALKYISVFILGLSIEDSSPEGPIVEVLGLVYFLWFLPELMIGGEHPPHHWYTILARLVAGVGWNIPAAAIIWVCLKERIEDTKAKRDLA